MSAAVWILQLVYVFVTSDLKIELSLILLDRNGRDCQFCG